SEADRDNDEVGRPGNAAGQFDGGHAGVVHAGNAAAHDGAAGRRAPTARAADGNGETSAGDDNSCNEGRYGPADIVGDGNAWIVGEHGDEVGRPDAAAGRDAGGQDPDGAGPTPCGTRAIEQVDGREAGEEAEDASKQYEAPIMFDAETRKHAVHLG